MLKKLIRNILQNVLYFTLPPLKQLSTNDICWDLIKSKFKNSHKGNHTKLYSPYKINNSVIGNYSYISPNSNIANTTIGKFCSIGPNLICGWGTHPTDGISTHPMFYSTKKQNGLTLSQINKIDELEVISIGNDVFIGANVIILNGITIGDGAIIGAGAVVSKDIPPYAIAIGCPIKISRYRFDSKTINKLKKIQWWNLPKDNLNQVESNFFNIEEFIEAHINEYD